MRLGIDVDSLESSLSSAFDASTYEDFINGFSNSMRDAMRNALVAAFLETAAMSAVLKRLSDAIFNAMRDGNVNAEELAGIKELGKEAQKLAGEFYKVLENAGLTATKEGGKKEAPDMSKWNLDKLFAERARAAEKGNKKRREEIELEIKARLKIDVNTFKSSITSAFDSDTVADFRLPRTKRRTHLEEKAGVADISLSVEELERLSYAMPAGAVVRARYDRRGMKAINGEGIAQTNTRAAGGRHDTLGG